MEQINNNKKFKFNNSKNNKGGGLYRRTLMDPVHTTGVRIPGTFARKSVIMHRHYQETRTLVGNDFAYSINLGVIQDSVASTSDSMFVTDTYNAAGAGGFTVNTIPIDFRPLFNLTTGTAREVRTVSAQVRCFSLASALNLTGTIQTAHLRQAAQPAYGFGVSGNYYMPHIPTINSLHPVEAIVNQGDGIWVNYLPSDEDDFAFLAPNTTALVRHPTGDDIIYIAIIGQGLPTNSQIRMEIDINFEVIPVPETSLAGLEDLGNLPGSIPALDVEYVVKNKPLFGVVRSGRSYSVQEKPSFTKRAYKITKDYIANNLADAKKYDVGKLIPEYKDEFRVLTSKNPKRNILIVQNKKKLKNQRKNDRKNKMQA